MGGVFRIVDKDGNVTFSACLLASIIASMAACGLVQAASVAKPVPAKPCAAPPLSAAAGTVACAASAAKPCPNEPRNSP
jgi:hypothetical protein